MIERMPGDPALPLHTSDARIDRHFGGDGDTLQCSICEKWLDADCAEYLWRMEVCPDERCIDRRVAQLLEAERKYDAMQHDIRTTLKRNGRVAA